MLTIGIFHDGLTIPAKEGVSVHAYNMAVNLSLREDCKVTMIVADRGRCAEDVFAKQPFDTLLVPPDDYYSRVKIKYILDKNLFDVVQNYNNYYIASVLGPAAASTRTVLVSEQHDLESDLKFLHHDSNDLRFQESMQVIAMKYASLARFISNYDYDKFTVTLSQDLKDRAIWLPVGLKAPMRAPIRGERGLTAVFIGNMSYMPNKEAAIFIIKTLAPSLPDIKFVIIGRESKNLEFMTISNNVTLEGEVEDLGPYIESAMIGLAPINQGSGIKIKILTYLSYGLPVIATSTALHGFPSDESLIKCDDTQDMIERVSEIVNSSEIWKSLSHSASDLFKSSFNISNQSDQLVSLYRETRERYRKPIVDDIGEPDMSRFPWHRELRSSDVAQVTTVKLIPGVKQ